MVSAIRQTCRYLLEIKLVRLLFQMERGIRSLRSLNRWACERYGFLQVSFCERQAELLVCKKSLLAGLIAESGLETERQRPSLLLRSSSWHPTPGRAAWLCWLSHRQPWGQGNGDWALSGDSSLMVAKVELTVSLWLNPSFALSMGPASALPLAATSREFWSHFAKWWRIGHYPRQHRGILQGLVLNVKLLRLWEVLGLL